MIARRPRILNPFFESDTFDAPFAAANLPMMGTDARDGQSVWERRQPPAANAVRSAIRDRGVLSP